LVAVLARALARTKQSWKTNLKRKKICIKREKACQNRLFSIFFADLTSLANNLFIFATLFETKTLNLITN